MTLEESGLPENRFFATDELLRVVLHKQSAIFAGWLDVHLSQGLIQTCLQENYSHLYKSTEVDRFTSNKLPAPIALIPFDVIEQSIDKVIEQVFTGWVSYKENDAYLIQYFPSTELLFEMCEGVNALKEGCKELDKTEIYLETNIENKEIKMKKSDFEKTKQAFIGNNAPILLNTVSSSYSS